MRSSVAVIAAAMMCVGVVSLGGAAADTPRSIMPWFCLERCGANASDIEYMLNQIASNSALFSKASFEMYNLGPNGSLVKNNLTQVNAALKGMGVKTYPMISSYPYPPQFLDWMRQLFNDSAAGDNFIQTCLDVVQSEGYAGMNVDWEPQSGTQPTPQDAIDYANFLNKFAIALHGIGAELTVDVGSWSLVWNYKLLAQTALDRIINMDTYCSNFTLFQERIIESVTEIGLTKLGAGLSTLNLNNNQPFSNSEIGERFELVNAIGVSQIDIWLMPIPDQNGPGTNWLPYLAKYLAP